MVQAGSGAKGGERRKERYRAVEHKATAIVVIVKSIPSQGNGGVGMVWWARSDKAIQGF